MEPICTKELYFQGVKKAGWIAGFVRRFKASEFDLSLAQHQLILSENGAYFVF